MWRLRRGGALLFLCAVSLVSILSIVPRLSGLSGSNRAKEEASPLSYGRLLPESARRRKDELSRRSKEKASWRSSKSFSNEKRLEKHSLKWKTTISSLNSINNSNVRKSGYVANNYNWKSSRSKRGRSLVLKRPPALKWRQISLNQSHVHPVGPLQVSKKFKHFFDRTANINSIAQKGSLLPSDHKKKFKASSNSAPAESAHRIHSSFSTGTPDIELSLDFLKKQFPKIMIVGFGKAGTKALFEVLKTRPDLIGPVTETRFFSRKYDEGIVHYLQNFPRPSQNQWVVEKSPDYIITAEVPSRLAQLAGTLNASLSDIKFVVVLRDPIERAVSEYLEWAAYRKSTGGAKLSPFPVMAVKEGGEINSNQPFINGSNYLFFIRQWLKFFDTSKTCFVDGNRFSQNPFYEVNILEKCLNLPTYFKPSDFIYNSGTGFYCFKTDISKLCMAKSKGRKHPKLPSTLKSKLVDYYRPMVNSLFQLIGRTLLWPNFSQ